MDLGLSKAFEMVADKLQLWIHTAIKLIPNLIVAIIILLVFFGIGWFIRKAVRKALNKITSNKAVNDLLEGLVGVIVVGIGLFFALSLMHLDGAVTTLLAGAGVVGLALGFAFQDIAANFISGIILSFRHPFGIGDIIKSNKHFGYVHKINMRCTIIRTTQGQLIYIPNKEILNKPFTNYSWNHQRRIDLECRCSYGDDLDKVQALAIEAVKELGIHIKDRPVETIFDEFDGSSVNFDVRFWIEYNKQFDFRNHRSEAIKAIKKNFEKNDIKVPFPIRTVDFDARGGKNLDEMLSGQNGHSHSG